MILIFKVMVRFYITADKSTNAPGKKVEVGLEAIVLKEDETFDMLPLESKRIFEKGSCKTIRLWGTTASWQLPSNQCSLLVTPGINLLEGSGTPADVAIRWMIGSIMDITRRGGFVKDAYEWEDYAKAPTIVDPAKVPFRFVVEFGRKQDFVKPAGETSNAPTMIKLTKGKRKGVVIDVGYRRKITSTVLPTPSATPKYSTVPHDLLRLDRSALPPQIPEKYYTRAVQNFSSSISYQTQIVYSTTARHMLAAEKVLGRNFSCPPTDQEQLFFLTYLQGKA